MVSCNTTCSCCVFNFRLHIGCKGYFRIHTYCGTSHSHVWLPSSSAVVLVSVPHTAAGGKAAVAQGQLGVPAPRAVAGTIKADVTRTAEDAAVCSVQPADSQVWGLGKSTTVCLWPAPWAPFPISFRRRACQVAISRRKISTQFLGLRRQAILDLHSSRCYIRLVYYVSYFLHPTASLEENAKCSEENYNR